MGYKGLPNLQVHEGRGRPRPPFPLRECGCKAFTIAQYEPFPSNHQWTNLSFLRNVGFQAKGEPEAVLVRRRAIDALLRAPSHAAIDRSCMPRATA